MSERLMFRGVGGDWSPHADLVDDLMTRRMRARGFKGKRTGKRSIHVSTSLDQASGYSGTSGKMFSVRPLTGAVITWVPQMADMLLSFQSFARRMTWESSCGPILRDAMGDVEILDTYLSMGRGKAEISRAIDSFLNELDAPPTEFVVGQDDDVWERIGAHEGEIWITGPVELLEYEREPEPDEGPSP